MRIAGLKRDDAEWMGWAWKRFTQPETMVAWIEAGLPVRAVNLAEGLTLQAVSPEMLPEVYTQPATGEPAQLVDIVLELGPNEVLSKVLDAAGVERDRCSSPSAARARSPPDPVAGSGSTSN